MRGVDKFIARGFCKDTGYRVDHIERPDDLGFLPPSFWMARDPHGRLPASGRTKADAVATLLAKYPDLSAAMPLPVREVA